MPNLLKISKITPLDKGGETTDPTNFRPISTLSTFTQIFEKLVYKQIISYFEKLDILFEYQFGFCKGRFSAQARTEITDTMHDVSNDVITSQLKDLFIPTVKIHSYNTRSSVSDNFYIKKSKLEIKRNSFSVIGVKLWNEIPTKLRTLPKLIFKRKIRMILFNILESEDSYEDLESIISKVRK